MPTVVHNMPPFRHSFYAIAIKVEGQGKAITDHHSEFPDGSVLFFNSPFQIISWDIAPDWEGYYVMISQDHLSQNHIYNNLLDNFPFLKIGESLPFNIHPKQEKEILSIFEKIYKEYYSDNTDKLQFIDSYIFLLLNHIKRYFFKHFNKTEASHVLRSADIKLLTRYQKLIELHFKETHISTIDSQIHSPSFYAKLLNVHPNHLNATVKNISGLTALQHIHNHIINSAKAYLTQTSLSVKEIAFALSFDAPNNFSNFFKKHTQSSPGAYRKKARL